MCCLLDIDIDHKIGFKMYDMMHTSDPVVNEYDVIDVAYVAVHVASECPSSRIQSSVHLDSIEYTVMSHPVLPMSKHKFTLHRMSERTVCTKRRSR